MIANIYIMLLCVTSEYLYIVIMCHRCSVAQACPTLSAWTAAHQASLSLTISHCLSKFDGDAIQPSHPLMPLLLLPPIFPSIRDFPSELAVCIRWPKYWSISFSISPSNEYSGLISLTVDWFDLLAVQWILRSLFQHQSLKASILWHSVFFMVQFSQPYMTTGKTIALTIQTFVVTVMSLLFNTLSRFFICFWYHGCSQHLQWFWRPRRGNLSLFPLFSLLFARTKRGQMPWSSFS